MIAFHQTDSTPQPSKSRSRRFPLEWLTASRSASSLDREQLGEIHVVKLTSEPVIKQRRRLRQMIRQLPVEGQQLVVDVSQLDPHDCSLPRAISEWVDQARRCRISIRIAGISAIQQALLELTQITNIVACHRTRVDAICALLSSTERNSQPPCTAMMED